MVDFGEEHPELVIDYNSFYNKFVNYLQLFRKIGRVSQKTGSGLPSKPIAYFNR